MFLVRAEVGEWLRVEEILLRWYSAEHIFIKVLTEDGRVCVLRYDGDEDLWVRCLVPLRPSCRPLEIPRLT